MPDARLQRTRETLPEGYQFGSLEVGADGLIVEQPFAPGLTLKAQGQWRAPHENNPETLHRQQRTGEETV